MDFINHSAVLITSFDMLEAVVRGMFTPCNEISFTNTNTNTISCVHREKYRIQHDFLNLNKAIKMIEQASVLSGEEKSFIDSVWSLILVKSNQYAVEGFDFAEINDMLFFLVTS